MGTLVTWGPLPILIWLGVCLVFDLRTRQVPNQLTVFPLLLAAIWRLMVGDWVTVVLVLLLILISDFVKEKWRIPAGVLLATYASMVCGTGVIPTELAVFAVWLLWEIGAMGGADAKILMAILLLTSDYRLLVWVAFAGGLQGLVALLAKRKSIPYTVAIALGTIFWLLILVIG